MYRVAIPIAVAAVLLWSMNTAHSWSESSEASEPESPTDCSWLLMGYPGSQACADSLSLADQGREQARMDRANDCLRLQFYGLHRGSFWFYVELLEQQLDVEVFWHGCSISSDLPEWVGGYNEVMVKEIERRFGEGILDSLSAQARRAYAKEWGVTEKTILFPPRQ
jgi:hypothetical protein